MISVFLPKQITAPALAALAKRIRGDGAVTCCCHVIVDDPNEDNAHVQAVWNVPSGLAIRSVRS